MIWFGVCNVVLYRVGHMIEVEVCCIGGLVAVGWIVVSFRWLAWWWCVAVVVCYGVIV